jgi:hypothetical protein
VIVISNRNYLCPSSFYALPARIDLHGDHIGTLAKNISSHIGENTNLSLPNIYIKRIGSEGKLFKSAVRKQSIGIFMLQSRRRVVFLEAFQRIYLSITVRGNALRLEQRGARRVGDSFSDF